jgi:prepilin-type N-terminal cleavage/methylation domain-containing protein
MRRCCATGRAGQNAGFTLLELLVVIAIISLLVSITLPSLSHARTLAQASQCLSNLHHLGLAMGMYHADNNGVFWRCTAMNSPSPGKCTYFWGAIDLMNPSAPVDCSASPLLKYTDEGLGLFWCEAMPFGSYVPQGSVSEPTTTYAYNGRYLDPPSYFWNCPVPTRSIDKIPEPAALFVFDDAAMVYGGEMLGDDANASGTGGVLKNSTHMEPPQPGLGYIPTPTTQFRHFGRSNALCADGHAAAFELEGGHMLRPDYDLGFVGATNEPHYEQK